jgi:hypothetical protein
MPFPQRLAKNFGNFCPKKADACTATTSEMLTKRTYCERVTLQRWSSGSLH